MRQPHDLALFDLDGTISDPLVGIARSINHALSTLGFAPQEFDQLAVYIGPPLDHAFRAIARSDSPDLIETLIARYRVGPAKPLQAA
jgi:phosphoglycolate phosphatase